MASCGVSAMQFAIMNPGVAIGRIVSAGHASPLQVRFILEIHIFAGRTWPERHGLYSIGA